MQKTALCDAHAALGARMVEFAGWHMPVRYSGIKQEHLAVRGKAGLFDISHMGEIEIKGGDAAAFCQFITTNDVAKLKTFQAQYGFFCNERGGVVDDIIVSKLSEGRYFICVNCANTAKDFEWITSHKAGYDVEVLNRSLEYSLLALQGPEATRILSEVLGADLSEIKRFYLRVLKWRGVDLIVSRTGYTGEDGFEIFLQWDAASGLWEEIMEKGESSGVLPCGLGARDTLRIEMAYPLYGQEIDEDTTPFEARLDRFVKMGKGDFLGREALRRTLEGGLKRSLEGFVMVERGIPRQGYKILKDDVLAGTVTSGTMSPSLDKPIGLGHIATEIGLEDKGIEIEIHGSRRKAEVVSVPFMTKES
ncbi:MAG: glycine cleavage system aminomethyltransferase GcvT [Thermodesulfobacteriota bacterium]